MEKEPIKFDELSLGDADIVLGQYGLGTASDIKTFEHGMVNEVFCINDKYVLKINTDQPELKKLEKEEVIYEFLSNSDIPVPHVYGSGDSLSAIPFPFILMEKVLGKDLTSAWETFSEEEKQKTITKYGELLGKIHTTNIDRVKIPETVGWRSLQENIQERIEAVAPELISSGMLPKETVIKIVEFYKNNKMFQTQTRASLLHGNYVFGNVMIESGEISGVIDWEWASLGHSEEELATVLYRGLPDEQYKESFLRGYTSVKPVSNDFEQRRLAYVLLYFLKALPSVSRWSHRPDKQEEYRKESDYLIKTVLG